MSEGPPGRPEGQALRMAILLIGKQAPGGVDICAVQA